MTFRADLHMHTLHSDGTDTVESLLEKGKKVGLSALSITDHDTIDAYPKALELAPLKGLQIISGVELNCHNGVFPLHVLGYGFSIHHEAIRAFCEKSQVLREKRNHLLLDHLLEKKIALDPEELLA